MPRTSRKARNTTTAKVIHAYFRDASDAKAEREETLKDSYRAVDPHYLPEKIGHPRVKSGHLWAVKNTKLSWLLRAIKANGVWARAEAVPEYRDAAVTVTKAIQSQFTHRPFGNERSIESGLDQAFPFGDHYWMWRWEEDGVGNYGVKCVNLNIFDVFPDPWEGRWIILRRFVTLSELARMANTLSEPLMEEVPDPLTGKTQRVPVLDEKGKPAYRDGGVARRTFKKVERAVKKGEILTRWGWHYTTHKNTMPSDTGRYSGSDDFGGSDQVDGEDDPANVRVPILEWHETAPDGVVAKIIPDAGDRKAKDRDDLFLQEATQHPYAKCQIVRYSPWPAYDEAWGYTLDEIAGDKQKLKDFAIRASARRTQRYADPAIKFNRRGQVPAVGLRSQSNVAIPLGDMGDIEYMDPPAGGDMHHLLSLLMTQGIDLVTGESEQRRGGVGGASSATEAAIAEQGGSTMDFLIATHAFLAIEESADLILRILRKHVQGRSELLIPFLGRRTVEMLRLTPEILDNHYWIRIGGSVLGGNPQMRGQNLLNIATQLGPTGAIDFNAVAEFALTESGFNADTFLTAKQGPVPVPPDIEHEMLEQREYLQVSPQDNHEEHMAAHGAELQLRQADPLTDPDLAQELLRHLLEHQMALSLQQQAQAGGGQEQGGAKPFQPSDAGKPGQPAAFNARTAGVNQERQAPNNGGAPQPAIAPGRIGVLPGGR